MEHGASSARLALRRFEESDRDALAAMNTDPRVMEFLLPALSRSASDAQYDRIVQHWDELGWGIWALEERASSRFVGFAGLYRTGFEAPFTPCVELAWRLVPDAWGKGYASEAARAACAWAFGELGFREVVSFTVPANLRSRRVMERLGMTHDAAEDFDHPRIESGDPLRRHVLYRLSREAWLRQHGA
jgi:RimJ/RimL family protein N-acetyltransferase